MNKRFLFPAVVLVVAMLACNFPSNAPPTSTAGPLALSSATFTLAVPTQLPTQTPPPTNTPLPTFTVTSSVPIAFPKEVNVNCRLGPGTAWIPISALVVGQSSQITGKTSDASWWLIADPQNSSRRCWVSNSVVNTGGNLSAIPVVEEPEAEVTDVAVKVDPQTTTAASCAGPISAIKIKGTIETNGPTTVKWRFETQLGGTMGNQSTNFDTFGSKDFTAEYTPPLPLTAGTYWVKLIVFDPNDLQEETSYKIECT